MRLRWFAGLVGVGLLSGAAAATGQWTTTAGPDGLDILRGDRLALQVTAPPDAVMPMDVRLEPYDPMWSAMVKDHEEVFGCDPGWRGVLAARGVGAGRTVEWALPWDLPLGMYVVASRPTGTNEVFMPAGAPFWIITSVVDRAVPCAAPSVLSLDIQPAMASGRERARRAAVYVSVGDRTGLGVIVNPAGFLLVPTALLAGEVHVDVRFQADSVAPGAPGLVARFSRVGQAADAPATWGVVAPAVNGGLALLEPAREARPGVDGAAKLPERLVSFAELIDQPRSDSRVPPPPLRFEPRGMLFGFRLEDGAMVPVRPSVDPGAVVDLTVPLTWRGALDPGTPVVDRGGRVWGIAVGPETAIWSVEVVDALLGWHREGLLVSPTTVERP